MTKYYRYVPRFILTSMVLCLVFFQLVQAKNSTTPGEVISRYPTLTCLAVEWLIDGDDDEDAMVEVSFRATGESQWRQAMPLVRVPAGDTGFRSRPTYSWPNKFSGSIFDLRPDTEYEIRLSLSDPDGGKAVESVTTRTRPVPKAMKNARVIEVNPRTLRKAAMRAEPGDILLLSPGYYEKFEMPVDGEPGRPIVLRADNAHPVIGSTFDEVSLEFRKHVILDGVTVHGPVRIRWAENVAVRYCNIKSKFGIIAKQQPGAKNCYIADNTVSFLIPWVPETTGSGSIWGGPANVGEGIELTGPGNVICYNKVTGFRDCISTMEDLWVYDQYCIDIYNNDISVGPDDGIEADFCMNNCRIMRNRITNCGMGLSSQPGLGGPIYFIRNVMYNLGMAPFKLERHSVGNLFLHNTVVKTGDGLFEHHGQDAYFRAEWRNNLCIGGSGGGARGRYNCGDGLAVGLIGFNPSCRLDHNAVGTSETAFAGMIGDKRFENVEQLNKLTGGKGNVRVDMSVFASGADFPDPAYPSRDPVDLRIAEGSVAEDAAVLLPNINDDFTGQGPDMGAYEIGKPLPHYGPRPRGMDESTVH
jgi:hypothetical protein